MVRWVRTIDGFVSFGFAVFFAVATFQDFYMSSAVVTDIVFPEYRKILNASTATPPTPPDVCKGPAANSWSVNATCVCLTSAGSNITRAAECIHEHRGLPSEQVVVGRVNPNYLLFHVFLVASIYQLVLQNSLDIDMSLYGRNVQLGVTTLIFGTVITVVMSLFNHEFGMNGFVLINFLPQQVVLLMVAFFLYSNAHFDSVSELAKDKYKKAIFSGVYNISTMPFIILFICVINSWTTTSQLSYMYTMGVLLTVMELAYHCVFIDASEGSENPAAKIRMKQAVYLLLITVLVSLTVTTMMYLPSRPDNIHRSIAIIFIAILWLIHILFDCTHSQLEVYMYERSFNIYDACLAVGRYMILAFTFYIVWGSDMVGV
ncbi:hypothetical protein T484DRAFT_1757456 [Baffinella frigidus]|nr:hypothetical protein T484DRAFT_1757456 [Cryptophyta sp. CCMP2293]